MAPTKQSRETWQFVRYMGVCVGQDIIFRQVWGWGENKARTEVYMSGDTRARDFRICNRYWRHIHQHRTGGGGGCNKLFRLGGTGG